VAINREELEGLSGEFILDVLVRLGCYLDNKPPPGWAIICRAIDGIPQRQPMPLAERHVSASLLEQLLKNLGIKPEAFLKMARRNPS
jgi:hypothetical protein